MKYVELESFFKKRIFFFVEHIRKEPVHEKLIELENNQQRGRGYLKKLQLNKSRDIIKYAYEFSPFYHQYFQNAGVNPLKIESFQARLTRFLTTAKLFLA